MIEDRQLTIWDYQGMNTAERERQPEVSSDDGTQPDKSINRKQRQDLLEKIISLENLRLAYKKVKANKGSAGIDEMEVQDMHDYFKENINQLIEQIGSGCYQPQPVRRVEIPKKEKGKTRKLGIPTIIDRVIQQAIVQVLTPLFEPLFSDNSFGFRPKRSAHDALLKIKEYVDEGFVFVVDMDLEKFFDTVNHSKLVQILSNTIEDGRVISLIHKYLKAGVIVQNIFEETDVGTPQGGPVSPLLANIMLNELDKELEKRGHKFVRYADDCMILCRSQKAAERTCTSITRFIEEKLFLKVNREKTSVEHFSKVKFLGYGFYVKQQKCRFKVHPKSIDSLKEKIRERTDKNKPFNLEKAPIHINRLVRGWVNYFRLADMRKLLKHIDEWMRRRLRMCYWKQWKKVRTRYRKLRQCGISHQKAYEYANTRKGYWRIALSPVLTTAISNARLRNQGYLFFSDYYKSLQSKVV